MSQTKRAAATSKPKGKTEWVPSGLPKRPVDHHQARAAALDPDSQVGSDTCYGNKSPF